MPRRSNSKDKRSENRSSDGTSSDAPRRAVKKVCYFCQSKTVPSFTDINNLRRFVSDRFKVQPRMRSGACSKHQRLVAKNIKYARHLALLPFVPRV